MARPLSYEPFVVSPGDSLANEHASLSAFLDTYNEVITERRYNANFSLKELDGSDTVLGGSPEQSRKFAMACVAQLHYLEKQAALAKDQKDKKSSHAWSEIWGRRRLTEVVLRALMRRNLPFMATDILAIARWGCDSYDISSYSVPVGAVARAIERFAQEHPVDGELCSALKQLAVCMRSNHDKEAKRAGTAIELACAGREQTDELETKSDQPLLPAPKPAPAGSPQVLDWLKQTLHLLPEGLRPPTTLLQPDHFAIRNDSPLRQEHEKLSVLFAEVIRSQRYHEVNLNKLERGRQLLLLKPREFGRIVVAAAERYTNTLQPADRALENWQASNAASRVSIELLKHRFEVDRAGVFDLLLFLSTLPSHDHDAKVQASTNLMEAAAQEAASSPLTEGERYVLSLFRASLILGPALGTPSAEVKVLTRLIQDGAVYYLAPGEAWSDAVNQEMAETKEKQRTAWTGMFRHALTATTSRPSAKWLKSATEAIKTIGEGAFVTAIERWFPLVPKGESIRRFGAYIGDTRGGSDTMHEENATILRGLLWCIPLLKKRDDLVHVITTVALSAYKKVPGVGPRAVKVGNACIYALSALGTKEAVGQLAMLKVRVKFGTAQKEIEKAFDAAAAALGLPRDQIEELGVPSYGLEDVGRRTEMFGSYRAELTVTGSDAALTWFDEKGKQLKSVPAKVKTDHKDDLKELQQSLKDIQSMLPAQRDRIDGLFLLQKSWPITEWRERYHDHPLVGTIARRLLWCVDGTAAFFENGVPSDVTGQAIEHGKTAEITLWHPVGRPVEEITSWRNRLEQLNVTQPFKQAYREVYLLTDAERNTRTYSNRYAAHIIRQHQFNALCAARGWKNALRLMVDADYNPPTKTLPQWGLRAEFWIEGIGDNYGVDTNDAGSYLRLATDQVRFYRLTAAQNSAHASGGAYTTHARGPGTDNINDPLPLDQIPPLLFSEIMRDVDLFVGVASVGNDPTWQDGGPEGRFQTYWQSYSFGELSGTASTRKQVLERLVPRLKIAKRCSFSDRFLVVKGDKRTYKIHLGSGNILMEPNDQYLCIVPDARQRASQDDLYLPFEGDGVLSIILSKALMLADDTKIKDSTITRQIDSK